MPELDLSQKIAIRSEEYRKFFEDRTKAFHEKCEQIRKEAVSEFEKIDPKDEETKRSVLEGENEKLDEVIREYKQDTSKERKMMIRDIESYMVQEEQHSLSELEKELEKA